ncbi:hypothetical protein BJV82DRAFT_582816 [Fennellomyces sp. T-0311]|nr:hypothetical protein BJV82DRAFT_582816 [Fennellomyces sp. T-0311]
MFMGLIQPEYAMDRFQAIVDRESEIDAPSWSAQHTTERQSLYTPSMFIPEAVEENHYIPVTAVINRISQDEQAIYHTIKHILKYPFIKEIYINNQFRRRPLSEELFQDLTFNRSKHDHTTLHIIQPDNYDMARFSTCAHNATYSHCYFQDDLALNLYMDTQYTNFIKYPSLIHANARPSTYVDHQKWRFQRGNDLHVGYAQFRYGAIVEKSLVQAFVDTQTVGHHADINFVIWSNQYPWILANPLTVGDELATAVDPINNRNAVQRYMPQEASSPQPAERYDRASCANDHCLFTTSMSPYDSISVDREFNTENITSIQHWETLYQDMDVPSPDAFTANSFHYAVDNNPRTCWNSYAYPKEDDFIGLHMVGTIQAKRIIIHLRRPIQDADDLFKVTVSPRIFEWRDCKVSRIPEYQNSQRIALHLDDCAGVKAWNSVRIAFTKDLEEPIEICGFDVDNMII